MSTITKSYIFVNGQTADATLVNANFDTIFTDYNGNITDVNLAASGITTYGKVKGTSLSGLASISASAGAIPSANIGGAAGNLVSGTVAAAVEVALMELAEEVPMVLL